MPEAAEAYRTLISARSRRLRITGVLFLLASLGMAIYGSQSLMPMLRRSASAYEAVPEAQHAEKKRSRQVVVSQTVFVYGYWTICGLCVLSSIGMAWLDVRETSRNYLALRRTLWQEAEARVGSGKTPGE